MSGARVIQLDRDGVQLHLELSGPPPAEDRHALLILDGIGCSGWAFKQIIPTLAARHPVLLMHYRGHGRSTVPPRPWKLGIEVLADDAAAACARVGLESVVAIGFSMGFQVALELFRRHRERVAGLVSLAGPSGRVLDSFQRTHVFGYALPLVSLATKAVPETTSKFWRAVTSHPLAREIGMRFQVNAERLDAADLDIYLRQVAEVDPELFTELLGAAHRHCADDLLPRVNVPTRIIAGARDSFVPLATMRELAFSIPHAQWQVLTDATHALPAEFPGRIADELLRFVAESVG
ncbi:MAG: alpha/beta hydrolase [Myxococcales bacterium]|nr:alpha/beta hydrolase [Myxococcales bacterium]MCB9753513.1 alpha/beta hydrolase [Myxococcales bacterium]